MGKAMEIRAGQAVQGENRLAPSQTGRTILGTNRISDSLQLPLYEFNHFHTAEQIVPYPYNGNSTIFSMRDLVAVAQRFQGIKLA